MPHSRKCQKTGRTTYFFFFNKGRILNNKVKKSNATFLVIFNHCEYQDQLLIFSVTDMSIFLFVIIITEKKSLETKKKNPSKLWIYLLDPFDSLEF